MMGYHAMLALTMLCSTLCFYSGSNCYPLHELDITHDKQTATVGQSFTLSCHVNDAPVLPVNWWFRSSVMSEVTEICVNGDLVNDNRKRFSINKNSYDLTLISPTLDDSGNYTCVEDHGFGTRHITQLHVKVAEPMFFNPEQSATVGQLVTLPCHSNTPNAVKWLFRRMQTEPQTEICANGQLLVDYVQKFKINSNDYSLIIPIFKPEYAGVYTCVDDAGFGASHVTSLTHREAHEDHNVMLTPTNSSVLSNHSKNHGNAPTFIYPVAIGVSTVITCILLVVVIVLHRELSLKRQSKTRIQSSCTLDESNGIRLLNKKESHTQQTCPQHKLFARAIDGGKTWTSHTFLMSNQQDLLPCIDEVVQHLKQGQHNVDAIVGMSKNPDDVLACALLAFKLNVPCVPIESSDGSSRDDVLRDTYLSHNKETVLELVKDACRPNQKLILVGSATANSGRTKASIALVQMTGAKVVEYIALGRGGKMKPAAWSLFESRVSAATNVGNILNDGSQPSTADQRPTDVV